MTHNPLAISVFLALLAGCASSGEKANMVTVEKTYLDSLKGQAEECQQWKEEKVADKKNADIEKSLVGQYNAYVDQLSEDAQTTEKTYQLIIENIPEQGCSDPNKYRVRNLMNEGYEWKLSGVFERDLLILSGNNATNTKRLNGSIQLLNGSHDSLLLKLTIRENVKKTDDLIQEVHETWVRKEAH